MHPSLRSALTDTVVAQRHATADRERLARLALARPATARPSPPSSQEDRNVRTRSLVPRWMR